MVKRRETSGIMVVCPNSRRKVDIYMNELLFTPAGLLDLFSQIDELKNYDIGITETIDGELQINVGDSIYELSTDYSTNIEVDNNIVETVEGVNLSTYEELSEDSNIEVNEIVESGILKEIAKTILVGGLVRLTSKVLK